MMTDHTNDPYRQADARTILAQLGKWTAMSIGLREILDLGDGIRGRIGMSNPYYKLVIRLYVNDTYHVQIIRRARRDKFCTDYVTEFDSSEVYCDQLSEIVSSAWAGVMEAKGR
jgi:hypothetical protein